MTSTIAPRRSAEFAEACADRAHGVALVAIRIGDALTQWGHRSAVRSIEMERRHAAVIAEIDERRSRHPLTLG